MRAALLRPAFCLVYIFDIDYGAQEEHGTSSLQELIVVIGQLVTEMLHHLIPYV